MWGLRTHSPLVWPLTIFWQTDEKTRQKDDQSRRQKEMEEREKERIEREKKESYQREQMTAEKMKGVDARK